MRCISPIASCTWALLMTSVLFKGIASPLTTPYGIEWFSAFLKVSINFGPISICTASCLEIKKMLVGITATVIYQQEQNNIFRIHTDFGCKIQDSFKVPSGMVAQINRKIGKIGNFVLKNRRKIGKSIVLFSTKIDSLHHIREIIKATSPQLLCSQDLDQLSQVRRCENDQ